MTDVLDTIEWELLSAIRRSNARRRRRRRFGILGGAALGLTVATAGVGAVGHSVLDDLLNGNDTHTVNLRAVPDAPRARLSLDDAGGNRWTLSLHRTEGGQVVLTALPDDLPDDRFAGVTAYNPLTLVLALQDGPLVMAVPAVAERGGRETRLLIGDVDADARAVTVVLGGRRYETRLTPQALVAPVERPPAEAITPEGTALLERLDDDELRLRGFAVALPDDALPAGVDRVAGTVETELQDGTVVSEPLQPACASAACGETVFKLPDQDG